MQLVRKEVERECAHLCSKNLSCLRNTDKEDMLNFSMEKLCSEVEDRAPMLHTVLSAAARQFDQGAFSDNSEDEFRRGKALTCRQTALPLLID